MLILKHMRQLVDACYPASREEAIELWHNIKPIKFGLDLEWLGGGIQDTYASYEIPEGSTYLVVMRVESFAITLANAAAPGFGDFGPPPQTNLRWELDDQRQTAIVAPQLLLNADDLLIFPGGHTLRLIGNTPVSPDGETRQIRTLVYSYLVNGVIADRIGSGVTLSIRP